MGWRQAGSLAVWVVMPGFRSEYRVRSSITRQPSHANSQGGVQPPFPDGVTPDFCLHPRWMPPPFSVALHARCCCDCTPAFPVKRAAGHSTPESFADRSATWSRRLPRVALLRWVARCRQLDAIRIGGRAERLSTAQVCPPSHFGLFDDLGCQAQARGQCRVSLDLHDHIVDDLIDGLPMGNEGEEDTAQRG